VDDLFIDTRSTEERRILDLRAMGFRTMLVCGRYEYTKAQAPLAPQSHPNWLVIVYLERGFQRYEIAGETVDLQGGQMMRVLPGERYGTGKFPEHRGTLYWLILACDEANIARGAWGMESDAAAALLRRLTDPTTPRVETASIGAADAFRQVIEAPQAETPLDKAILRHRLVSILLETGLCQQSAIEPSRLAHELAKRLELDPGNIPGAEEMANFAGLSVSAFYRRFGKETGMTPKDFAMRWKVNEALKRLRTGGRVTDIAHSLGFSSSQYFASVVKRHSGQAPGYWKRGRAEPIPSEYNR
jgi:AraC-like DNA-binding protein